MDAPVAPVTTDDLDHVEVIKVNSSNTIILSINVS